MAKGRGTPSMSEEASRRVPSRASEVSIADSTPPSPLARLRNVSPLFIRFVFGDGSNGEPEIRLRRGYMGSDVNCELHNVPIRRTDANDLPAQFDRQRVLIESDQILLPTPLARAVAAAVITLGLPEGDGTFEHITHDMLDVSILILQPAPSVKESQDESENVATNGNACGTTTDAAEHSGPFVFLVLHTPGRTSSTMRKRKSKGKKKRLRMRNPLKLRGLTSKEAATDLAAIGAASVSRIALRSASAPSELL